MIGNVFAGILFFKSTEMTAFAVVSLGIRTAFMFGCAVNCCSNVVAAVGASHVPAGAPTLVYEPSAKCGLSTPL